MSSRGATVIASRVTLSPKPWRWGHPRVLIENPDEAAGLVIVARLRAAGYAVALCPGPRGHGQCPMTASAGCSLAHDADLVVCSLGYERQVAREVLRELRRRYPEVRLLVEVPWEIGEELRPLLAGCHQLAAPATPEKVVAAVRSLTGNSATADPL